MNGCYQKLTILFCTSYPALVVTAPANGLLLCTLAIYNVKCFCFRAAAVFIEKDTRIASFYVTSIFFFLSCYSVSAKNSTNLFCLASGLDPIDKGCVIYSL